MLKILKPFCAWDFRLKLKYFSFPQPKNGKKNWSKVQDSVNLQCIGIQGRAVSWWQKLSTKGIFLWTMVLCINPQTVCTLKNKFKALHKAVFFCLWRISLHRSLEKVVSICKHCKNQKKIGESDLSLSWCVTHLIFPSDIRISALTCFDH